MAPLSREAAAAAIASAIHAVQQGRQQPLARLGTSARSVLGLWRALGRPNLQELAAEISLVAAWARESPDRLAARDIRAEGWAEGTDRSRALTTLVVQRSWADRLAAAQAWDGRGRPQVTPASPAARPNPAGRFATALQDPFEALQEQEELEQQGARGRAPYPPIYEQERHHG